MTVDIDAIAIEDGEPFRFRRGDDEFTMATLLQLDWRDQETVLLGTDTVERLRILFGAEQYERFAEKPLSTARLIKLLDLWYEHQGIDGTKSEASPDSSKSTARH